MNIVIGEKKINVLKLRTMSDYAKEIGTTKQNIFQKVKRASLPFIRIAGVVFIIKD